MGIDEGTLRWNIVGRLQVTRQKCRARTKPLESIRKAGLGS
jgi:hypothetical protein